MGSIIASSRFGKQDEQQPITITITIMIRIGIRIGIGIEKSHPPRRDDLCPSREAHFIGLQKRNHTPIMLGPEGYWQFNWLTVNNGIIHMDFDDIDHEEPHDEEDTFFFDTFCYLINFSMNLFGIRTKQG